MEKMPLAQVREMPQYTLEAPCWRANALVDLETLRAGTPSLPAQSSMPSLARRATSNAPLGISPQCSTSCIHAVVIGLRPFSCMPYGTQEEKENTRDAEMCGTLLRLCFALLAGSSDRAPIGGNVT